MSRFYIVSVFMLSIALFLSLSVKLDFSGFAFGDEDDNRCPVNRVRVGPLCVDMYEASVWSKSPRRDGRPRGTQFGVTGDDYPCSFDGNDCSGIGGSPAIPLKAGASIIEPTAIADDNGFLMMNIDKGNQDVGGNDAQVIGDIGVDVDCFNPVFQIKKIESEPGSLFEITTDGTGSIWLIVGTDSGFEGITNLFYTEIKVSFIPK